MNRKKGIAEETARVLRERIMSGTYAPGTRLPPERELAPELGTNRATLREALRTLGAQGLVHARQGSGIALGRAGVLADTTGNDVKEHAGNAGVGEVGSDALAHDAGAEHGDLLDGVAHGSSGGVCGRQY